MFGPIFRFELNFHRRQFLFYVLSGVFFLLTFLSTTSPYVSMGPSFGNVNINAPISVISTLATISILTMFGAVAFAASGVIRDYDLKTAELFLSTRVSKFAYIYGRFFGALVFSMGVFLAGLMGVYFGELAPWLDQERIGATSWSAYIFAFFAIGLPNIFVTSSIFFCLATVTRSMMLTYVAAIAFLMLTFVLGSFTEPETVKTVAKIEPFGLTALAEQTRYWTVFEKNDLVPALQGDFLLNRVLWSGIGVLFLGLAYVLFPFSVEAVKLGRKKKDKQNDEQAAAAKPVSLSLPSVQHDYSFGANLKQYLSQTRMEIRLITRGAPFIVLMLLGLLNVIGAAAGSISNIFGTPVYPTTGMMILLINGSLSLSLLGVLVYYSGEIMLKERDANLSEITDSMPYPNWVMMAAKLTGLVMVVVMMLLVAAIAGIGVQFYNEYYEVQPLVYLQGLLMFFQFPLYFMCVASIFFFVVTRSRYITMFLMVLYSIGLIALPQMGLQHYLYRLDTPGVPYSIFTGYSHQIEAFGWYTLYWSLWGLLLLIAIHLLWPRGAEFTLRSALAVARQRLTPTVQVFAAVVIICIASSGGYIYYNTNVLNPYITTTDLEKLQAEYEKKYKQYQYMPRPQVTNVYAEVDIYPDEREVIVEGYYDVVNFEATSLDTFHITLPAQVDIDSLEFPGAVLESADKDYGYYIYRLDDPMQPNETRRMTYKTSWLTPGFLNHGASRKLTSDGTFFNNLDVFPIIGYQDGAELQDQSIRRKHDLEPIVRMRDIDDPAGHQVTTFGARARVDFETIVSTSQGQLAIAPGYLQNEWEEDGRAYYHYKMDAPIWNFYSFLSGDYEVKKDTWNDVSIEVYYKHGYNVDRMIYATQKSLDYFTENFSDYQYRQFRIIEFPRYQGTFAQSFPNTIPFSESIGFVADLREKKNIDYVYYVTAHELAHQWWAHQVLGADVQGQTVIVETLAQYFALMVMKNEYGEDTMKKFLEFELDNYLRSRGGELIEELPLYLVENQQYIHYRKGSVALYALQDYLGEDTVNAALRSFINKYAFKGAPFPTTRDLLAEIRAVAGPQHEGLITDLFEKIVLFDLKVDEVAINETTDGRYEVKLDVSLAKFEADGEGQETEVDVSGQFDIALLGEKDEETDVYDVIYIDKHPIDGKTKQITIISDTRPVSVGIDPFNKLIDRNPEDNIKAVDS